MDTVSQNRHATRSKRPHTRELEKQILCYFEPSNCSMADLLVKNNHFLSCFEAVFRAIFLKIQDDHQCAKQLSGMQQRHPPPNSVPIESLIGPFQLYSQHGYQKWANLASPAQALVPPCPHETYKIGT